tara:strand:- start:1122 stop:1868 length:747 start_codon:yes stop_codon:yes gene_type:complete
MQLYNGDCLEIMKSIKDKSVDAIITDPPYGTTACKWDSVIPFDLMWKQLNRIIKPNGAVVLFGSEPFSSHLRMSNIKNYKYDWIWNKLYGTNIYEANKRPMKYHELISVFYKEQPFFNKQMTQAKKENQRNRNKNFKKETKNTIYGNQKKYIPNKKDDKLRNPITILEYSNQSKECHRTKRLHPTQKPLELMEYLIKTYTNENETVLDFACGSGTTGVACCNTNRNFIGIELDKQYFKIAEQRINNLL